MGKIQQQIIDYLTSVEQAASVAEIVDSDGELTESRLKSHERAMRSLARQGKVLRVLNRNYAQPENAVPALIGHLRSCAGTCRRLRQGKKAEGLLKRAKELRAGRLTLDAYQAKYGVVDEFY